MNDHIARRQRLTARASHKRTLRPSACGTQFLHDCGESICRWTRRCRRGRAKSSGFGSAGSGTCRASLSASSEILVFFRLSRFCTSFAAHCSSPCSDETQMKMHGALMTISLRRCAFLLEKPCAQIALARVRQNHNYHLAGALRPFCHFNCSPERSS